MKTTQSRQTHGKEREFTSEELEQIRSYNEIFDDLVNKNSWRGTDCYQYTPEDWDRFLAETKRLLQEYPVFMDRFPNLMNGVEKIKRFAEIMHRFSQKPTDLDTLCEELTGKSPSTILDYNLFYPLPPPKEEISIDDAINKALWIGLELSNTHKIEEGDDIFLYDTKERRLNRNINPPFKKTTAEHAVLNIFQQFHAELYQDMIRDEKSPHVDSYLAFNKLGLPSGLEGDIVTSVETYMKIQKDYQNPVTITMADCQRNLLYNYERLRKRFFNPENSAPPKAFVEPISLLLSMDTIKKEYEKLSKQVN